MSRRLVRVSDVAPRLRPPVPMHVVFRTFASAVKLDLWLMGSSISGLARILRLSRGHISRVIHGRRPLSAPLRSALVALGGHASEWLDEEAGR